MTNDLNENIKNRTQNLNDNIKKSHNALITLRIKILWKNQMSKDFIKKIIMTSIMKKFFMIVNHLKVEEAIIWSNFRRKTNKQTKQILKKKSAAHFVNLKITRQCKRCKKKFYFNNKFHKHIKKCKQIEMKISKAFHKRFKAAYMTFFVTSIIESTCKRENFHEFAFRNHHYATMKKS